MTGTAIKQLRKRLGASAIEMAALFAVALPTVYRWEHAGDEETPPIGLAQRQLFHLIGKPSKLQCECLMKALRTGGVAAAWAHITRPYGL